jgi:hypothetical protein
MSTADEAKPSRGPNGTALCGFGGRFVYRERHKEANQ